MLCRSIGAPSGTAHGVVASDKEAPMCIFRERRIQDMELWGFASKTRQVHLHLRTRFSAWKKKRAIERAWLSQPARRRRGWVGRIG
jgi:hypothetical protein